MLVYILAILFSHMLHLEDVVKEEELKPDQISMSSTSDNSLAQSAVSSESTPNIEVTVSDSGISIATTSTASSETVASVGRASKVENGKRVIDKGMEAPVVRSRSPSPKPSPKKSPSKKGAPDSAEGGN